MPARPPAGCVIPGSTGWVPGKGREGATLLLVGEAPGALEAIKGEPFVGPAGGQLDRILRFLGRDRAEFRIANTKLCRPPGDFLVGAFYEDFHCQACDLALENELSRGFPVVVTLGGTALRKVMHLPKNRGKEAAKLNDWHGAPVREPRGRFWVVPTFHPAHLLRGQQKLTKTVCYDIQTALDLVEGKWEFDLPELIIDPPTDWFENWKNEYLGQRREVWLAVDIETPDKGRKSDEGDLSGEDASYQIDRVNLCWNPNQGITVPGVEPYIGMVKEMLAADGAKIFWNAPYDVPRLKKTWKVEFGGEVHDFMDAWHVLQPTLPRGLGFVAPFYSRTGPWKHLGNRDLTYCAMDGVQTLRIAYGVAQDLQSRGQWEVYYRDCFERDMYSLRPAEEVGIRVNVGRLRDEFIPRLKEAIKEAVKIIGEGVPDAVKPLDGPYAKRPVWDPNKTYEDGWEGEILEKAEGEIRVCEECSTRGVPAKHRCKGWRCGCGAIHSKKPTKKGPCVCGGPPNASQRLLPRVVVTPVGSVRYYKRLPFNPDSWQQVLAYIKFRKHKPGTAKKTKKETTDKKTLMRLVKTGDPFYSALLKNRQAAKMLGTYGEGILNKTDEEGRVHGHFGHLPWTMRLSSVNPNLQNLADHVEWAAEFKRCIEAGEG